MTRRVSLLLIVVLAFGLVSLAAAQQEDSPSTASNPLVQRLQNSGVVTAQEAAAINQAPTPAEQQERLTQLLRSKGIVLVFVTPDEYNNAAAAETGRNLQPHGMLLSAAAFLGWRSGRGRRARTAGTTHTQRHSRGGAGACADE